MTEPNTEQTNDKPKPKLKPVSKNLIDGLIHWVVTPKCEIGYLVNHNGVMEILENITIDGITYRPKQDMPFDLPNEAILFYNYPYEPAKLLKDVELYLYNHVEMPDDKPHHYLILALWILHTYMMEHFTASPIMYAHGQKECGKSRLGTILSHLAYRSLFLTNMTGPSVFRIRES